MADYVLLCSDLDRTLLPNGSQAESPQARKLLWARVDRSEVTLAYISVRHWGRQQQAIEEYDLPQPGHRASLYLAHGGLLGMNGNYIAGAGRADALIAADESWHNPILVKEKK